MHHNGTELGQLEAWKPSRKLVPNLADRFRHGTGRKVCRYNWHSPRSLGWPFPMLKYTYIFQIKYTEAILSQARDDGVLGCSGISWTICKKSAPRSRQITTPTRHHSNVLKSRLKSQSQLGFAHHWSMTVQSSFAIMSTSTDKEHTILSFLDYKSFNTLHVQCMYTVSQKTRQ